MMLMFREHNIENFIFSFPHRKMSLKHFNGTKFQVSEFILREFPSIHSWQHRLSLPLALLYVSAIGINVLIFITIYQDPSLKQPTYLFLGILPVVDMGFATTIVPKILAISWFDAKVIGLPEGFAQIYSIQLLCRHGLCHLSLHSF